jgi:hypothetical protein
MERILPIDWNQWPMDQPRWMRGDMEIALRLLWSRNRETL